MSMELHVHSRNHLNPDPEFDGICMLFYCVYEDHLDAVIESGILSVKSGSSDVGPRRGGQGNFEFCDDEMDLIMKFVEIVRKYSKILYLICNLV